MTITEVASGQGSAAFIDLAPAVTVPAGLQNSAIIVLISTQDSNQANLPIGIVIDGTNTYIDLIEHQATGNNHVAIWYAKNPPAGTYTIEVDPFGTVEIAAVAYLVSDCDLTRLDASVANSTVVAEDGNAQNPSINVTTIDDQSVVLSLVSTEATITGVGGNQTETGPLTGQSFENAASSQKIAKTPAGVDNQLFTTGSAQSYAICALALSPKAGKKVGSLLRMFS